MSAFRTVKGGDAALRDWDWFFVGAATIVIPPFIGAIAAFILAPLMKGAEPSGIMTLLAAFFIAQTVAPIVTIFAVPLAILVGIWALRLGWAGWAMSLLVPVVLIGLFMLVYAHMDTGYMPSEYVEPGLVFSFSGALHGLVMWLCLRWRRPDTLAPRQQSACDRQ